MNAEQFVVAIRKYVADSIVDDTIQLLLKPPGRQPAATLVKSSEWYKSLLPQDQKQVMTIVADAVHAAIFGFMCVLDGVKVIDDAHSEFQLFSVNPTTNISTQLSGSEENDSLHDLYKALDPD